MTLPGTNATLLEVRAPGGRKPNGDPGGPGAVVWSGNAPVYLSMEDVARTDSGREVIRHVTRLDAFLSEGGPATEVAGPDWQATSVLVDAGDGGQTRYTVISYERKGQGTPADKVRLELDNPVSA